MDILRKKIMTFGGLMALSGILAMGLVAKRRVEYLKNPDKCIHKKLLESKKSLEKTASVIQSVLDEMDAPMQECTNESNA